MRILLLAFFPVLFGCACMDPTSVDSFPTPSALKTPARFLPLYEEAQVDFALLRKGAPPVHARAVRQIYDGGSIFYEARGYKITSWRRLSESEGKTGILVGPEIVFHAPISRVGRVAYSDAHFQFLKSK